VTEVSGLTIIAIEDADIPAVVALWERCELTRPWNEPQADIARARSKSNSKSSSATQATPLPQPSWWATTGTGDGPTTSLSIPIIRKRYGRAIMTAAEKLAARTRR
jgi:hypothetical protein